MNRTYPHVGGEVPATGFASLSILWMAFRAENLKPICQCHFIKPHPSEVGHPLSADEYFLSAMAVRQD